jgi:hypothetical protein
MLDLPDQTELVVAELTLDKDISSLVSRYQAILRSASYEDPGKLGPIRSSEGRETGSSVVRSQGSLTGGLDAQWCLSRGWRESIESGVWTG